MITLYIMAENFCNDGSIKGKQIDHTRIYLKHIAKMGEFFNKLDHKPRFITGVVGRGRRTVRQQK